MKSLLTCKVIVFVRIIFTFAALLVETLNEDDQKRSEQEMEITFEPGLQKKPEQVALRKLGEFYFTINPNCQVSEFKPDQCVDLHNPLTDWLRPGDPL